MTDDVDGSVSTSATSSDSATEHNDVPPKTQQKREHTPQKLWSDEDIASAKADYMTGQFNTLELSKKHGITRHALIIRVKPGNFEGDGWAAQLVGLNIRPKDEPPIDSDKKPPEFWEELKKDLVDGMNYDDASEKFKIHKSYISKVVAKFKWKDEIVSARQARQRAGFRKKHGFNPPIESDSEDDDLSGQMQEFVKAASIQLKMITGEIRESNRKFQKIPSGKLEDLIDKFGKLADAARKMKSASAAEMTGSGGSGRIIRPGVMDQASCAATDPAPTL